MLAPTRTHSVVWWNASSVHVSDVALRTALAKADVKTRDWSAGVRLQVSVDAAKAGAFTTSRKPIGDAELGAVMALEARYRLERGELTQGDIRDLVLKLLLDKAHGRGVRIKEGGSLYLLPAPHDEIVDKVKGAFEMAGLHLRTMPVFPESLTQLRVDVHAGLLAEVAEVRAEVEKRKAAIALGKGTKVETLTARRADLDDLRLKAQLFRSVLAEDLADVERVIADAHTLINETDTAILDRVKSLTAPAKPADVLPF